MYLRSKTLICRTTQLLKEHDCFGAYLRRIGAAYSTESMESGGRVENTQNSLSDCPAYESQRIVLKSEVNGTLTLGECINCHRKCAQGGNRTLWIYDEEESEKQE